MSSTTAADPRVSAVASEVRVWLVRRGMSASQASARLGWSQIYLSRRLTGAVPLSVPDLIALADLLAVNVADFFESPKPAKRRRSGGSKIDHFLFSRHSFRNLPVTSIPLRMA